VQASRSSPARGPWQRSKVVPGTAASGACWEGAGSAAGGCGSALAHPGRSASCRKKKVWEGALGAVLSVPPLLTARVGAGGAGVDRGDAKEHGYRRGANQNSEAHSSSDLLDFHLQGVRRNARKSLKFEFLKFSTLGDQHIGQGF
jgi:hypothetical protein